MDTTLSFKLLPQALPFVIGFLLGLIAIFGIKPSRKKLLLLVAITVVTTSSGLILNGFMTHDDPLWSMFVACLIIPASTFYLAISISQNNSEKVAFKTFAVLYTLSNITMVVLTGLGII